MYINQTYIGNHTYRWTNLRRHINKTGSRGGGVCVCVCVCIYIYIYIYTHFYVHSYFQIRHIYKHICV